MRPCRLCGHLFSRFSRSKGDGVVLLLCDFGRGGVASVWPPAHVRDVWLRRARALWALRCRGRGKLAALVSPIETGGGPAGGGSAETVGRGCARNTGKGGVEGEQPQRSGHVTAALFRKLGVCGCVCLTCGVGGPLRRRGEACVYVSNHQSSVDFALYYALPHAHFKGLCAIAKASIMCARAQNAHVAAVLGPLGVSWALHGLSGLLPESFVLTRNRRLDPLCARPWLASGGCRGSAR